MNNLQLWQAIGAVLGGFAAMLGSLYLIVTRPLLKRMDDLRSDMNTRFAEVIKRLDRIESKLENHSERITRLEERTSLFALRKP